MADGMWPTSPRSSTGRDSNNFDRSPESRTPTRLQQRFASIRRESSSSNRSSVSRSQAAHSIDGANDGEGNEQSPLLAPQRESAERGRLKSPSPLGDEDRWYGEGGEETKSTGYLVLLTLGALGLQIAWSVETSHFSPYLLSLGLSKSLLALVWIAGPLSGTLVQPYVGVKSDNCRVSWGRRKPFIVGGAAATILSMMLLAWAREIVGGFLGIFGVDQESGGLQKSVIIFAVAFVYILDFAINVIQAGIRAFVVDCAPTHQQEDANAWFIRASGIGNILGYLSGFVDLPRYLPFLGGTQFVVLCAIASFTMALTVAISCLAIKERNPLLDGRSVSSSGGVLSFFRDIFRAVRHLPPQIRQVCIVQFFAWIGWFPFLFYITTYIGGIYAEPFFEENPNRTKPDIDAIWERATRMGTLALLVFALTTFAASVVLPFVVEPTYQAPNSTTTGVATPMTPTTPNTPMSDDGVFPLPPPKSSSSSRRSRRWPRVTDLLPLLRIRGLTLVRAWALSHLVFALCMFLTFLTRDTLSASILVAAIGLPWAVTNWAPFALIAAEISRRDAIRRGLARPPPTRDGARLAAGEDDGAADQAGVILGIHNVAIAAPQVIATLVSSVIFRFMQKERGLPGDESVAWVLRFGGCCALLAAWLTRRVGDGREVDE